MIKTNNMGEDDRDNEHKQLIRATHSLSSSSVHLSLSYWFTLLPRSSLAYLINHKCDYVIDQTRSIQLSF